MNCETLARTGTNLPWVALGVGALVLIVVGVVIVRLKSKRGTALGMTALLVVALGIVIAAPASDALAACQSAATNPNSLSIVQTSVNDGLTPSRQPTLITGRVTNNGPDETYITTMTVSVVRVHPAATAVAGSCDTSDFVLSEAKMPVGARLDANGGAAAFSGAHIGLRNKPVNQDACKGATLDLLYVAQ